MSLWSTFYSGNVNRLESLLHQEDWQEIGKAEDIQMVDFSGGTLQPFLFPDDFNQLVLYLKKESNICISTFTDSFDKTIWGSPDAEYQAAILDSEFVRSLSGLKDDSLVSINAIIKSKKMQESISLSKKLRLDRIKDRIKIETAFAALPLALSLGVLTGDYSVLSKILVPFFSFGIVYGLRFWFLHLLDRNHKTNQYSKHNTYDWTDSLIKLRNLAKTAIEKNENVVYLWSL